MISRAQKQARKAASVAGVAFAHAAGGVMLKAALHAHLVGHVLYTDLTCSKQMTEAVPYLHQLLACMPSADW